MFLTRIVALTSEVSLYRILCVRRSSSMKRTNHETFYIRKDDTWKCKKANYWLITRVILLHSIKQTF